jgi:DNA-binding CsgD family transcriptional regulator
MKTASSTKAKTAYKAPVFLAQELVKKHNKPAFDLFYNIEEKRVPPSPALIREWISTLKKVEQGPQSHFLYDFATHRYVYSSPLFKEITGYEAMNLMVEGQLFFEKICPDYDAWRMYYSHKSFADWSEALVKEKGEFDNRVCFCMHMRVITPDKEQIWISRYSHPLSFDENGKLVFERGLFIFSPELKRQTTAFGGIVAPRSIKSFSQPVDSYFMPPMDLTEQQLRVLTLINKGYPAKRIATELGISVHTVNEHYKKIKKKTGSRSMIEALSKLKDKGIV